MIERSPFFDFVSYAAMVIGLVLVLIPFWVVIVAGSPPGTVGSTNLIRVHRLGEDDHA